MKKAKSVFASKAERKAFRIIETGLPPGWRLYHNLPLSQVVKLSKDDVTDEEWNFYLRTSVDFVLATETDEPFLVIEFDGLAGGYSAGRTYKSTSSHTDPQREMKFSFKLGLSRKVDLPIVVISFEEIEALPGDDTLRLVHGIVAQYIVSEKLRTMVRQWDQNDRGLGRRYDQMQWDLAKAETDLQHKYDPFRRGLEALWAEFSSLKVRWSLEPVSHPPALEALRSNLAFERVGCTFSADNEQLGQTVSLTVWVRNLAGEDTGTVLSTITPVPGGINPLQIAENAAWYLGVKKVVETWGNSSRS